MFCQKCFRYNTRCLFTGMIVHNCSVPLSSIPCHFSFPTLLMPVNPASFPQEFIRHKLEEEQRQLEILQQQLLQEQALLMVTSPHSSFIMSCFDCRGFPCPLGYNRSLVKEMY